MKLRLLAFTQRGYDLARGLGEKLGGQASRCGRDCTLEEWTAEGFRSGESLVFVGAVGIAVRAIAPFVKSKTSDPAVVAVDEGGTYAIPLLSGHLGGANDLARRIAGVSKAQAIITTATDVHGLFPVDQWARRQGLRVENPERIKLVSSKVLAGEPILVRSAWPIGGTAPAGVRQAQEEPCDVDISCRPSLGNALHLVPGVAVLGVGCKRGTPQQALEQAFVHLLAREELSPLAVGKVCSIDLKKDEPGLLAFCEAHSLPLETYSAGELAAVPGEFPASDFVRRVTGVDNVCQRAAALGSAGGAERLLGEKYQREGVTMALALGEPALDWRIYE